VAEFSTNEQAEQVVGKRDLPENALIIDFPCELGYHCPVCEYPLHVDGDYDERLEWSEYNAFVWCSVCDRDYPSCLCLPGDPVKATEIYLNSVKSALERAK
jgi:hypothetical protein